MIKSAKHEEESRIVQLLQSNSKDAVRIILERYGDALYTVALRIVGTKEVAEEILQDAFVKVWQKAQQYDPNKGRLFTWLLQIVRSTAIDKVRLVKFQREKTSQPLETTVYDNKKYSEEMQLKDVGLHKTLEMLDEKYQVVIRLLYLQGYTQAEVTEELGIPLGTVKSRAKIGIRELRRLLGGTSTFVLILLLLWVMIQLL